MRQTFEEVERRHGIAGAYAIRVWNRIYMTETGARAKAAKALINNMYKRSVAKAWVNNPENAVAVLATKLTEMGDYYDNAKIVLYDYRKPLGPGNFAIIRTAPCMNISDE